MRRGHRHVAELHSRFLVLLPRIETHGKIYFRHVGTFLRIIVFVVLPAQALQSIVLVSEGFRQTRFAFDASPNAI